MTRAWTAGQLLFEPPTDLPWMKTHAALPAAVPHGDAHRVYFSGRDERGRARIGYFDADLEAGRVLGVSAAPVLDLGTLGAFDDSGVTMSCLVEYAGRQYLYYSGWSLGVTVPFYFYVGLAIGDGERFERVSAAPILERNAIDPFLTASPWVLVEDGVWRMWYISCCRWELHDGQPRHYYHIRYAESADGIRWERGGRVCIDFAGLDEYAMARPCVVKQDGRYKMWFCVRGDAYRLAYAESPDGLTWTRGADPAVPPSGWDAEMQAYPAVVDGRWLLYNGNGYGRTGIGLARPHA
ncbi:MAG: uncharacterized protein JWM80_1484 [Cyanobacteria bacterium RYN_339]|nr:uncharacterized protein [Cyanobacteria bacterium RYN_339]